MSQIPVAPGGWPNLGTRPTSTTQSPVSGGESNATAYVEIMLRRKALFLGVLLTTLLIGYAFVSTRKPIYESENKLVISTRGNGGGPDDPMLATLSGLTQGRNTSTQVEILNSEDLLTEAYMSLSEADRIEGFGASPSSKKIPSWAYRIDNKTDTDVITIVGAAHKPGIAANLANKIAEVYLRRDLARNNAATHQASEYVFTELGKSKDQLTQATADLADYKHRSGLISPPDQVTILTRHIYDLQTQVDTSHELLESSQKRLDALFSQLRTIQPNIVASTNVMENPVFAQIAERISDLEGQRIQLIQKYIPKAREVRDIDRQISLERESLTRTAQTIVGSTIKTPNPVHDTLFTGYATEIANAVAARAQLAAAKRDLSDAEDRASRFPNQERQFADLALRVDVLSRTYNMLSDRYSALLIDEKSSLPNGLVASYAHPADTPTSPKFAIDMMVFLFVGTFMAVGLTLLVERLDSRVHDPQTVARISGLSNLSVIPETSHQDEGRPIIGKVDSNQALLEGYRILRNNIEFSTPGRTIRMLAITSPGRGDGKSTTSINLAIAMGMDGKRVLLVDCDLRRPSLHDSLDVSREVGLTSVAVERATLEAAILPTTYSNVYILPSGPVPPNPTEFLNSVSTRNALASAREMFDMVILDAPPCVGLSDMQVISQFVDGVVLVVAVDRTLRPQLEATMETLRQVGAPMIGTLLNRVEFRRMGYGYYYSYAYYYSYDYSEDDHKRTKHRSRSKKKGSKGRSDKIPVGKGGEE